MTSERQLSARALRTTRSWTGRGLLIVFGVGIGIAASVAVTDTPSDYRTVAADTQDFGDEEVIEGASGDAQTGGVRRVTTGGGSATGNAGAVGDPGASTAGPGGESAAGEAEVVNPENFKCNEEENGGSTDTGVTNNAIKVAANVVLDGVGASFLKEARIGIEAVFDEVNVDGICGRRILLTTRNDGWDKDRGLDYIQNYIAEGFFALAVNPSSEGLDKATQAGVIADEGIPVVGTDGMLISQYRFEKGGRDLASWIWPVTPSTISTMHVIAQHGVDKGAKTFGLVWDGEYKFGTEGRDAFVKHLERLGVPSNKIYDLEIAPGATEYTQQANAFNDGCKALAQANGSGDKCDLVAMLLDSSTAVTWIKANANFGRIVTSGPQTLFNDAFATNCEAERRKLPSSPHCEMIVWTGYNPPVGSLANLPGVAEYVAAINARDGQADTSNSFTQGAYLGARLFVEALKQVGPNVTRENLRKVLDAMTFKSDLVNPSRPLQWREGDHFANVTLQAFKVRYTPEQGFTGWAKDTDWYTDSKIGTE